MKFLLDACVSSRSLRKFLVNSGHDVVSASSSDSPLSDEAVLEWSVREQRILITKDKDFGELVFVRHLSHPTIIRFVEMATDDEVKAIQELLARYHEKLEQKSIIVVTRDRIKIRTGVMAPLVAPIRENERRKKFLDALQSGNRKYAKMLKRLAD